MYKTTIAIAFIFLIFFIQGIRFCFTPADTSIYYRLIGGLYLIICLVIIFSMNMKIGMVSDFSGQNLQSTVGDNTIRDAELHQAVIATISPMFSSAGQVGLVIATVVDNRQDITSFGTTTINSGVSPRSDTIFEIGSISKLFTAAVLSAAMQQNKLALDQKLLDFIPFGIDVKDRKQDITLRHLVTHTAGLPKMSFDIFRPSQILALLRAGNLYTLYSKEKIENILSTVRLRNSPGESFNYSNIGYGILGILLSSKYSLTYQELIKKTITSPLGQNDTTVLLDDQQVWRLAQPYRSYWQMGRFYLAQTGNSSDFADGLVAAGGIRSTGRDMLRFLVANMDQNAASPQSFLSKTHQVLYTEDQIKVGMGWFTDQLPHSGQSIIYHNGLTGGHASFIAITSDYRFGVVVLGNVSRSVDEIGLTLLENLIPRFPKKL